MSKFIELLDWHNKRRELHRLSFRADLLNERHTTGNLGEVIPMYEFIDADFLLGLRSVLEGQQQPSRWWYPWSGLYMQNLPFYLLESHRKKSANQLLLALGLSDSAEFVTRYKERVQMIARLLGNREFGFEYPLAKFNPNSFCSK